MPSKKQKKLEQSQIKCLFNQIRTYLIYQFIKFLQTIQEFKPFQTIALFQIISNIKSAYKSKRFQSHKHQMQGIQFQQILQMLNNPGGVHRLFSNKKIQLNNNYLVKQEQFKYYTKEMQMLFCTIFCSMSDSQQQKEKDIVLETVLKFPKQQTAMPICNKILTPREPVFRCYDCMTHEASVICKHCFENGNHKGHRYNQISSGGGNCDCGNPDAIKPEGFCKDHPGKADPVKIKESVQAHFLQIHLMLLEWVLRLYEKQLMKSADILGQIMSQYLLRLNEKSLYYNTLTFKLLFSKRKYSDQEEKRNEMIIDKIFEYGIRLINFARKITDVFFNMFSLDVFKYELTVAFTRAYNRIVGFQRSKFKSLYIQLFANNEILDRMIDNNRIILCPYNRQYDYLENTQNLMFISTIKPQVASKYFDLLISQGHVQFPQMNRIQKKVQNGTQHIISVINQNLNNQNYYYILLENIIKLVKGNKQSIIQMIRSYADIIMSPKYSYKKNKAIMPFHKVFAVLIMALYDGDIHSLSSKHLGKLLQGICSVVELTIKVFKLILECLREFAKTFNQTSYFENYVPLYAKSGKTIVIYDFLMLNVCLEIFYQESATQKMNQILEEIFQVQPHLQKKNSFQQQKNTKTEKGSNVENAIELEEQWVDINDNQIDEEQPANMPKGEQSKAKKILALKMRLQHIKLLIESSISDRSQVMVANSIEIINQNIQQKTEKILVEIMNNFKELTSQNLKILQKNFIDCKNWEELIKKFLNFDKIKKKYTLLEMKDEKYPTKKLPLFLYPTMKKLGSIFAQENKEPLEEVLCDINLEKHKLFRLRRIFNEQFVSLLTGFFIQQLVIPENSTDPEFQKIIMDFLQILKILQLLMLADSPPAIQQFFNKLSILSKKEGYQFLSENLLKQTIHDAKQLKKIQTKRKFEEKKKKKLEEFKKKQQNYEGLLVEQKMDKQQKDFNCIICRQENNQGICFLARFGYSNILQALNHVDGRSLVFDSCYHPIHIKCFIKAFKAQAGYMPCPLCKAQSNIMLPFEKQISNIQSIEEIFTRMITLKAVLSQKYTGFDKKFQEYHILSIFRAIVSMIGKTLIKGEGMLNHKDQRLANILYDLAKTVYHNLMKPKQIIEEGQVIEEYFYALKGQMSGPGTKETDFYAFEYITLKILNWCFFQQSNLALIAFSEPQAKFINTEDLKKVWNMCNQVASLPNFNMNNLNNGTVQLSEMSSKVRLYTPPETVIELIKLRDQADMSCKNGHQMCICIMCHKKACFDCKQVIKHIKKDHCQEGVVFNILTGGLVYVFEGKQAIIPSMFTNQMGFEWSPSKSPEGFVLDKDNYGELKQTILNETIYQYLERKYPQALKRSVVTDMLMF